MGLFFQIALSIIIPFSREENIRVYYFYKKFIMSFITQVSALVIKDEKVLMIKEKSPDISGLWNLPGAHIRLKERVVDAVIRGTLEETGLHFIPESLLGIYTSCTDNHYYHFVVKGNITPDQESGTISGTESEWVSLSEMSNRELINARQLENIIDDYLSGFHIPLSLLKEDLDFD